MVRSPLCRCGTDRWPTRSERACWEAAKEKPFYCKPGRRWAAFCRRPYRRPPHISPIPDSIAHYPSLLYRFWFLIVMPTCARQSITALRFPRTFPRYPAPAQSPVIQKFRKTNLNYSWEIDSHSFNASPSPFNKRRHVWFKKKEKRCMAHRHDLTTMKHEVVRCWIKRQGTTQICFETGRRFWNASPSQHQISKVSNNKTKTKRNQNNGVLQEWFVI